MRTEGRTSSHSLASDGRYAGANDIATVDELKERFAIFRRENPRNTRIPDDLRSAVITAMKQGVRSGRLRRACGLSTSQLARWRALAPSPVPSIVRRQHARVFSVIGDTRPRSPVATLSSPAYDLELRLGPWSVSVRLAGQPQAGRG